MHHLGRDARDGAESGVRLRDELERLAAERTALETEVTRLTADGQARVAVLEEQSRELTAVQVKLAELNQQLFPACIHGCPAGHDAP